MFFGKPFFRKSNFFDLFSEKKKFVGKKVFPGKRMAFIKTIQSRILEKIIFRFEIRRICSAHVPK